MKKIIILALGLSLTAASCNLTGNSGPRGVLKSEDGGETFVQANKLDKKGDIAGVNVNSLVFDPVDPDIMFIGSSSGILKTTNAAENWQHILKGMRVGDVVVDPSKTEIIYASGISNENGRIIKSTDSGATWRDIYIEPTKNNPVLSLAISPANSKVILAGLNSGEILRSVDEGNTWQIVRDIGNPVVRIEYTENTTAFALAQNNGLFQTVDQGSNWTPVQVSLAAPSGSGTAQSRVSSSTIYTDVAFDRKLKGVIFLASQQGLLRSIDNGVTWSLMSLPVTNETLAVSAVSISPTNSNNIYISVGSTFLKTMNGGMTWETRKLPTGQRVKHILINPQEPNKIFLGIGS